MLPPAYELRAIAGGPECRRYARQVTALNRGKRSSLKNPENLSPRWASLSEITLHNTKMFRMRRAIIAILYNDACSTGDEPSRVTLELLVDSYNALTADPANSQRETCSRDLLRVEIVENLYKK